MNDAALYRQRFQLALDLHEAGVAIQRQNFRRQNPTASSQEIEAMLNRWLQHRPGAEWGDGPRPDSWK